VGEIYASFVETSGTDNVHFYTWSVTNGALPDGLTLDKHTGFINGIPTAAGTFNFTVQIADEMGTTASQSFTISIAAASPTPTSDQTPIASPSS